MVVNNGIPFVVIEGIDVIIKRDLEKHSALLERSKQEKLSYAQARSSEVQRKRAWKKHVGGGKYDDAALAVADAQMVQNIAMFSAKEKLSEDAIAHHTLIVDTLYAQLEEYNQAILMLAHSRSQDSGHTN